MGGCASALTAAGKAVDTNPQQDVSRCKHLGTVTGSNSNMYGSASSQVRNATNDARNKAAKLGATHLMPGVAGMGSNQYGKSTSATIVGNAYDCRVLSAPRTPIAATVAPAAPKGPPTGTERGPCYGNNTCNEGLTCASDLCVKLP